MMRCSMLGEVSGAVLEEQQMDARSLGSAIAAMS